MTFDDEKRAYLVLLRSEHRQVEEKLALISAQAEGLDVAGAQDGRLAELSEHLRDLRQELEHHFFVEESGGCLDEAVARTPRIGREVDAIKAEHPQLLGQLDALVRQVDRRASGKLDPAGFVRQWEGFVAALSRHEAAEEHLLLRGLESLSTDV
jgi:hypothetical protein